MSVLWLLIGCVVEGKAPLVVEPIEVPITSADDLSEDPLAEAHPICRRLDSLNQLEIDPEWTGDVASCDAGVTPSELSHRAIAQLNFARELVGHPPITGFTSELAQQCAVLMHANASLSHYPETDWTCYTAEIAAVASESLLASAPGVTAVRGYLVDPGNDTTLGHRRWLLSPWVAEVGMGTTDRYSCMHLADYDIERQDVLWTAWPPPGEVPRGMLRSYGFDVDEVGWSLQSDAIDLDSASIWMVHDGVEVPVEVYVMEPYMGSFSAIRWVPPASFHGLEGTFTVRVEGLEEPFEYDVELIDCPE